MMMLSETIEALVARSDAIAALAVDGDRPLSAAFSKKENVCTADISIAFMDAVAATSSIEDIRALKPEIERLRDHVLSSSKAGFVVWSVLFVIVALQTVTLLRPMLSSADEAATRQSKLFFVQHFAQEVCR